jgi:hypothetical protein
MIKQGWDCAEQKCPAHGRMSQKVRRPGARLRRLQDGLESEIVERRATADEDGHYCFAVAL